jgi:hypothetical protein
MSLLRSSVFSFGVSYKDFAPTELRTTAGLPFLRGRGTWIALD